MIHLNKEQERAIIVALFRIVWCVVAYGAVWLTRKTAWPPFPGRTLIVAVMTLPPFVPLSLSFIRGKAWRRAAAATGFLIWATYSFSFVFQALPRASLGEQLMTLLILINIPTVLSILLWSTTMETQTRK
jgi:hypothetical protein